MRGGDNPTNSWGLPTPYLSLENPLPRANRGLAGANVPSSVMNRRHGLFIAFAIGLAAIAGTYAALQTTDLGAQAATVSEKEIAAADVRLDKQEAALRRAARKRPPRLPRLPEKASARAAAAAAPASAPAAAAPQAPSPAAGSFSSGPSDNSGQGSYDDHGSSDFEDDDFDDDDFDDHGDDDSSGHGGDDSGGDDD